MSHFAKVENGTVTQVIVAEQDFINTGLVGEPNTWIQTSYNTRNNVHYNPATGEPDDGVALRGNYAGIGYVYDSENDVFYPPKPFNSWHVDSSNWSWKAPVDMPTEGGPYAWNEETQSWDVVPGL